MSGQNPKNPKFKSAANEQVQGVRGNTEWKQPLKRHINPETSKLEFVTILVRVLSGDAEHDFHARFPPTILTASAVCDGIAAKERLSDSEASLFSLWVISKDLELQLRPDQDIFELMVFWNRWVMKYTHFPEAENAQHPVNRHWFVYRREASVTIAQEKRLAGNESISLLFGEAKRNLLTRRYCCSQMEGATIAAYQLQISLGNYSEQKCEPGYLMEDDRLGQLLPLGMLDKMRPAQWEEIITVNYKSLLNLSVLDSRKEFLEFARRMPCYGCSFFPACTELPPSGFFEFRTQNWFIGVGPNGVCVVDADIPKYVYSYSWANIATCRTGHDQFFVTVIKNGKSKEQAFISPQAKIISNLFTHCQYKYLKESGKLKKNGNELERVVVLKSSDEVPRASGGAMISPGAQRQLQQEPVRSIPAKSAVNNLKKSDSFGKSLASKMKGSVEKLNDVMGSSSNLKNSAGNLNRSLNQLGRTMTKKLNMQEEDIPVNTAKVKVSSEVLNEMSAVLPKGYKEGSYQITAPTVKQNFNATVAPTNEQLQKIRPDVQPQSQQIQGTPPQPAQQTVERAPVQQIQNLSPNPPAAEKVVPKSRMSHLPPSTPLASKSPRKTKLGLTEAEKQIMAALSEVPNSSPGDLPVGNGRGRESMMPPKKKAPSQEELNIVSELDAVAPKVEPLNNSNAVRKSMYPVRNNVPQQALEPSPQVERKSMQPLQHNVPQPNYYKQVIANNSHSENDGAPNKEEPQAVPKSRFGRVGQQIVANSVDPPNRNLSANRSPIAPENPGAHKVDSGSPKIQIVEQQSPVSIEVVGSSDDEEMVSPLPKPEFQRKRSSVFGTAIQPEAHRAASKKRQSSIGRGGSINRRANDVFGFDQGLGGVGPTELLDLRKAPLEKKKSEPRND